MAGVVPNDTSEFFAAGGAVVGAYQTSGLQTVNGVTSPTDGQADSYSVVTTRQPVGKETLSGIMDNLSDIGSASSGGSTGALVALTQTGAGSFDLVAGARGDSQTVLVKVAADNTVTIDNLSTRLGNPANPFGMTEFGAMGERGGNLMLEDKISIKPGEKVFVVTASDGLHEAYLGVNNPAARGSDMAEDIAGYLKANPEAQDLSRFLTERATALGTQDNTTVVATLLTSQTDLKGQSVVMGVFDGVGHHDNSLSSQLAKGLQTAVPEGQSPQLLQRQELPHIASRKDDLARTAVPETPDPHAKSQPQADDLKFASKFSTPEKKQAAPAIVQRAVPQAAGPKNGKPGLG